MADQGIHALYKELYEINFTKTYNEFKLVFRRETASLGLKLPEEQKTDHDYLFGRCTLTLYREKKRSFISYVDKLDLDTNRKLKTKFSTEYEFITNLFAFEKKMGTYEYYLELLHLVDELTMSAYIFYKIESKLKELTKLSFASVKYKKLKSNIFAKFNIVDDILASYYAAPAKRRIRGLVRLFHSFISIFKEEIALLIDNSMMVEAENIQVYKIFKIALA